MKHRSASAKLGAVLGAGIVVNAALAYGQLGERISRPSNFATPSSSFGILGGTYTATSSVGYSLSRSAEPSLLAVGPTMWTRYNGSAGSESIGGIRAYVSPQSPLALAAPVTSLRPLALPFASPFAEPLTVSLPSSVPEWGSVYIPGRTTSFDPTVKPDSFIRPKAGEPIKLESVAPVGPSASALPAQSKSLPAEQVPPDLVGLHELSQRLATKLSDEGASCLKDAMQALREGRLRSDTKVLGAIDLFKRARLLAGQQPEPTLGLIASLVGTGDYQEAAVLVGPLARSWPEVLTGVDFPQEYYARPEQMRTHLLALRDAVAARPDPDIKVLWAFYRWYAENRRQAVAEVDRLALSLPPDSAAAAVAEAMRAAIASGG